ncbi:MAG: hypothetical protein H7Z20_11165 [Bdellovibrio sp.]|nr:hypothetical protein [Methylotenera sp.]
MSERLFLHVGDPTIMAWIVVAAYFAASIGCFLKAKASNWFGGSYSFWLYLAATLFFLGINKQLDLQSWLTETLRDSAKNHGWYAYKRQLQVIFIGALGFGLLLVMLSVSVLLANSWRRYKLTWLGMALLCLFILLRAASFEHVTVLINADFLGLNINVALELGGLLLIIFDTFFNKNPPNLPDTNTFAIHDYVAMQSLSGDVQCPKCGVQPLSKIIPGRIFKCRSCGTKYRVNDMNG